MFFPSAALFLHGNSRTPQPGRLLIYMSVIKHDAVFQLDLKLFRRFFLGFGQSVTVQETFCIINMSL